MRRNPANRMQGFVAYAAPNMTATTRPPTPLAGPSDGSEPTRKSVYAMTDHDIHPGDTVGNGDFTVIAVEEDHDLPMDTLKITIEATGQPPAWLDAPIIKISRNDWRSFLLRNEFGGGYRAADGSLHTVANIINQAQHNGYTITAIRA